MTTFDMTNPFTRTLTLNHKGTVLTAPGCPPVVMKVGILGPRGVLGRFNRHTGQITLSSVLFKNDPPATTIRGVLYHEYAHHLQSVHADQEGGTGWGEDLSHPTQTLLYEKYKGRCAGLYAGTSPHEMAAEAFSALLTPHREGEWWAWDSQFLDDWLSFFLSQEGFKEFFPQGEDHAWLIQRMIAAP